MNNPKWFSVKNISEASEWICPCGEVMLIVYESGFSTNEIYYNGRVARWSPKELLWVADLKDKPNRNLVQVKEAADVMKRLEEWYFNEFVIDNILTDQE